MISLAMAGFEKLKISSSLPEALELTLLKTLKYTMAGKQGTSLQKKKINK